MTNEDKCKKVQELSSLICIEIDRVLTEYSDRDPQFAVNVYVRVVTALFIGIMIILDKDAENPQEAFKSISNEILDRISSYMKKNKQREKEEA